MEIGKLRSHLLHVLLMVLWFHFMELHVHFRLPPRLGLRHDRGEAKIAANISALGDLLAVQIVAQELWREHESLRCAIEIEEALDELEVCVGHVECLLSDVRELEVHLVEQDLVEEVHGAGILLEFVLDARHELPVEHEVGVLEGMPQVDLHLCELELLVRAEGLGVAHSRHHTSHHRRLHHLLDVASASKVHPRLVHYPRNIVIQIERIRRGQASHKVTSRDIFHFLNLLCHVLAFRHYMLFKSLIGPEEVLELVLIALLCQSVAKENVQVVEGKELPFLTEFVEECLLLL